MERSKKLSCFACGNVRACSYFRIPVKENIRRLWLDKLQISYKDIPASARICDTHFAPTSFSNPKGNDIVRKRLKQTAVPIQFTLDSQENTSNCRPVQNRDQVSNIKQPARKHCYVCGPCRPTERENDEKRSYFSFPRNELLRKQWFDILARTNPRGRMSLTSDLRLCNRHFAPENILENLGSVRRTLLKRGTLPIVREITTRSLRSDLCEVSESGSNVTNVGSSCNSPNDGSSLDLQTFTAVEMITSTPTAENNSLKTCDKACQTTPEKCFLPNDTTLSKNGGTSSSMATTPTTSCKAEISLSDHQYAECEGRRNRRSSLKPRYIGDVQTPHLATPRRAKECFLMSKRVVMNQRMTIDRLLRNLRDARTKIKDMGQLITHLKKNKLLSENSANNLMANTPDVLRWLHVRSTEGRKTKYSPELRKFALSLQFYSTKAYLYVRKAFGDLLPALSTIRGYCAVVDMEPGISKDVLSTLQAIGREKGKPIVCNLVVDEMALKEHTIRKGNKRYGYVNLGVNWEPELDVDSSESAGVDLEKANHGLVFLLTALNDRWKVPIAHFLIRSLSANERANLIRITLRLMYDYNVHSYSCTMDGVITNISVANKLGAVMDTHDPKYRPYFFHPTTGDKVFVFIDPCHDVKNVRNALGTTFNEKTSLENPFHDADGNVISWRHIYHLNEIQKDEGVHLANKITERHIRYPENKMNVRLAVQTLSNSVGDSLTFLRTAADIETPYKFSDSLGTSIFCKNFNDIFDFLNCRTRYKTQMNKQPYCVPLTRENYSHMKQWAEEKITYIRGLHQNGIKLTEFRRKCGFESFISCLRNIFELFDVLQEKHNFEYLLSYKLLQDMIETFFSAVRMCGGFCNNPTPFQFLSAMRRLIIHTEVVWSSQSNCLNDDIPILHVSSKGAATTIEDDEEDDELCGNIELFNFQNVTVPSNFVQHVVRYISGYIAFQLKMNRTKESCPECLDFATEPCGTSLLADIKNRGPLKYASEGVISVGMLVEGVLKSNKKDVLRSNFTKDCIKFLLTSANIQSCFPVQHFFEKEEHGRILAKFIIKLYLTVRLHHEHSVSNLVNKYVRRVNTKLVLYKHQ